MKSVSEAVLTAMIVALFSSYGIANETGTMMCKGGIVSIGATSGEVTSKCGQPASSSQREDKRVADDAKKSGNRIITTVSIDDWLYNFGPNQFQYRVLFENGRVARFESLDYGY